MKFKYIFTVLLPIVGLGLIIGSSLVAFFNYKKLNVLGIIFVILGIILGNLIIKISTSLRKEIRQNIETDEYGNKRKTYKDMSKQEKQYIDLITTAQDEQLLSDSELRAMTKNGSKFPEKDLNNLVGLERVKEKIGELEAQMEYLNKNEKKVFHMCFLGNPGTGKTSVCKILTGFLYKYKYIKGNKYIYTDASNIIACSDPPRKMKLILQKSHNTLLFIDEAYCFVGNRQGYEALTLLLNEMENNRDNLIIILAGYKKEMKELLNMNSGLKSRINTFLFFEDYSHNEMELILDHLAEEDDLIISKEAREKFINQFIWQKCLPSFANARTVRKIYENAKSKHFYNLKKKIISDEYRYTLTKEDICDTDDEDDYLIH